MADPVSVDAMIARHQPWAIVHAAGYVRVDEPENDVGRCLRETSKGHRFLWWRAQGTISGC